MSILNLFKKKRIVVNYNSSDLTENEKVANVMNENAYLKGQLMKVKADEAEKRESKNDEDEEKNTIAELHQQEKELGKKELAPISLFKIFKYIQKSKKKKKKYPPIKFTTFDASTIIGDVEDFNLMPDGALGAVADGRVVWASKDLNHVFYWIAGLNNFAKNKIIPLCMNSKGEFNPNVQTEEVSDLIIDSDGKFKIMQFSKKPLYEMIAGKNSEIQELNSELENVESTMTEQQKEINEKIREANLHKNRADKIESELSMALIKVAEIEMAHGQLARQNMTLMQLKEINEDLISSMENVVKKWGDKIEEEFGGNVRDKEWENLKEKLDWAKRNIPQTIYQIPEKEPKPSLIEKVRPVKI